MIPDYVIWPPEPVNLFTEEKCDRRQTHVRQEVEKSKASPPPPAQESIAAWNAAEEARERDKRIRARREREQAREFEHEREIPVRPLGVTDGDWPAYCAGVRARGRERARFADDYEYWCCGYAAPQTEAIARVETVLREIAREQRSLERLAERVRTHAVDHARITSAAAAARLQARAELAELALAATAELRQREAAAAAWRLTPTRPGSFGSALRAARSAMRLSDDLPERGIREKAYAALVESARVTAADGHRVHMIARRSTPSKPLARSRAVTLPHQPGEPCISLLSTRSGSVGKCTMQSGSFGVMSDDFLSG